MPSLARNLNVVKPLNIDEDSIIKLSDYNSVNTIFGDWINYVNDLNETQDLLVGLDCEWPTDNNGKTGN